MTIMGRIKSSILAVLLVPGVAMAQTSGTISGQVIDEATLQPLPGVQVVVTGTTLGTITNQSGRYQIINVPTGTREVRASLIGYSRGNREVVVVEGQQVTADFVLSQSALTLEGVVVTATGQEIRQREIGNAVTNLTVPDIELAPVTDFSQLLQGRIAGATIMQSSGVSGTGSRIRIRGNNSVSLSNAPLLIVDGVRVENSEGSLSFGVGGQQPSRFNDISPENIESIEVLKGPAAAALYGTAAANGVIQVTTRRGLAGAPQFRAWTEYGIIDKGTTFPDNVFAVGTLIPGTNIENLTPGSIGRCDNIRRAIGATPGPNEVGCTGITETFRFNPLENAEASPFRDGNRRALGGSVSGGGEAATFFLSGQFEDEEGVLALNGLRRINVQANVAGEVGPTLRVGTNIGFVESDVDLPQNDNALYGALGLGLYGNPQPQFVEGPQQGFQSDPRFFYDWLTTQSLSRFTGSANADWRPIPWLSVNVITGLDRLARQDINRLPRNTIYAIYGPPYAGGFIQNENLNVYNFNTNGSATAVFNLGPELVGTTALGSQYIREDANQIYAFGSQLTPGIETSLAGATADFDADEQNVLNATISTYLQQQLGWRDRLFFTGAVRGDKNTAFGTDIGWIWYPALSTSWVISEETFFPEYEWLNNLRLRGAWGQSGLRPGATDALQSFISNVTVFENNDEAAIVINQIGNPNLRPERSTEWELGFESGLFEERAGLELTYFRKTSKDALVSRRLPPSLGSSATRFENLGEVRNSGWEGVLAFSPVDRTNVGWNLTLTGSRIHNKLVDLGEDLQGNPIQPIIFGLGTNTQRHEQGFPLGAWFSRPVTFEDRNGDGLLAPDEVMVGDSAVFLGTPFPTRELSITSDVRIFDWARISGLLDFKGGHSIMNFTHANRCQRFVCIDDFDANTPLATQAAIIGYNVFNTRGGFVEDADFWKLREVAVTFILPPRIATRFGSRGLNLTFAARNLATWTDYSGFDPEVNYAGQNNFNSGDAASLPPNRFFTIRLDANF